MSMIGCITWCVGALNASASHNTCTAQNKQYHIAIDLSINS